MRQNGEKEFISYQFKGTRLVSPLNDKHFSLDSYNDFRSGYQNVTSLPSVLSLLRKSINTSVGQVFIFQYSEFIKLMLDRQVLPINSIYLYTVFQNGVFCF